MRVLIHFVLIAVICLMSDASVAIACPAEEAVTLCETGTVLNAGDLNIFSPASKPAHEIREIAWLVMGICAGIFVLVEGALLWSILKFHRASGTAGEPQQVFGSKPIELAWTVIPMIIVFVLALTTVRTIGEVQLTKPPEGSLEVDVIGHQWWWEYRFKDPSTGRTIVTANELVVPAGRPIWLRLSSADVAHSWWVPRLNGKTDLIPGHPSETWFLADKAGIYLGQCAEFCGKQHANMLLRVTAVGEQAFAAWCAAQASPATEVASVSEGRELFASLACANCHVVEGLSDGAFGPNLTHLMTRQTLGAGVASMDPASIRQWVDDPQVLKPGCNMPSLKLDDDELDAIVLFLLSLK